MKIFLFHHNRNKVILEDTFSTTSHHLSDFRDEDPIEKFLNTVLNKFEKEDIQNIPKLLEKQGIRKVGALKGIAMYHKDLLEKLESRGILLGPAGAIATAIYPKGTFLFFLLIFILTCSHTPHYNSLVLFLSSHTLSSSLCL